MNKWQKIKRAISSVKVHELYQPDSPKHREYFIEQGYEVTEVNGCYVRMALYRPRVYIGFDEKKAKNAISYLLLRRK